MSQLREEICREHEDGRPRRVTDLQFVATGDKLRTVPQAGRRFNGQSVDDGGNGKHEPRRAGVDSQKCCLLHHTLLFCGCKGSNKP